MHKVTLRQAKCIGKSEVNVYETLSGDSGDYAALPCLFANNAALI